MESDGSSSSFTAMGHRFPAQHQDEHPGKEHLMNPLPQPLNPKPYIPSNKLLGKVALVTGGDSGIGRSVCLHFAMEGATVGFTYIEGIEDVDKDETIKLIKECKTNPLAKDPIAISADLGYESECQRVVDRFVEEYGTIDILVNNAAVQYYTTSIDDITEARLEKTFRTNIFSYFFMAKLALKHMERGSCIINTASVIAYVGNKELMDYSATKGAIVTFTRSLALSLVERGIRVNAVAPGPIWTPFQVSSFPAEIISTLGAKVAMDRAGQPYEVAPSFVFLACEEMSSYFTGQVMHPNGGWIVNT
ncbi:Glucose and ribitol dehydrogenase [Linum grandiflorum]